MLHSLDDMTLDERSNPYLTEVTLDLASGSATTRRLPGAVPGDFPVVPPSLVGELAKMACMHGHACMCCRLSKSWAQEQREGASPLPCVAASHAVTFNQRPLCMARLHADSP